MCAGFWYGYLKESIRLGELVINAITLIFGVRGGAVG
jgi:hypothetical protein